MSSETVLWRFSYIGPLLHRPKGMSLNQAAHQLAAEVKIDPEGTSLWLSPETLWRWLQRYREHGVEGLAKQTRADRGRCRAIDAATVDVLMELAKEHPDWTVRALHGTCRSS